MIDQITILNGKRETLLTQLKRNQTLNLFTPEQLAETIGELVKTEKQLTAIYVGKSQRRWMFDLFDLLVLFAVIAVVGVIISKFMPV